MYTKRDTIKMLVDQMTAKEFDQSCIWILNLLICLAQATENLYVKIWFIWFIFFLEQETVKENAKQAHEYFNLLWK